MSDWLGFIWRVLMFLGAIGNLLLAAYYGIHSGDYAHGSFCLLLSMMCGFNLSDRS